MKYMCLSGACLLLLGGCSAADGKWPSLRTAQEQKGGPARPALPAVPTVPPQPLPVAAPAVDAVNTAIAPAVTRLQQEGRAVDFTLDRLAQNDAPAGSATTPAEATARQKRHDQLLLDLADSRDAVRRAAGQLTMATPDGDSVRKPFAEAGKLLERIATALGTATPRLTLEKVSRDISAVAQRYATSETLWQRQAKSLADSATAAAKNDPDRIYWNRAQLDLTRLNQTAKSFSGVQADLEAAAGDLAVLSVAAVDVSARMQEVGALLTQVQQRLAQNETLVSKTRTALERK